jgi:hypothetical protein
MIQVATHSASIPLQSFVFMSDPYWVSSQTFPADDDEIIFPKKISSHIIDSYAQLPERPDLAFMFLWMAINASYHQLAIRESFAADRERITDDYGLDCALANMVSQFSRPIGVAGSFKVLEAHLDVLLKRIPKKITAMMATAWLRSIAAENHKCSSRYTSRSYEALRKNFPIFSSAIEVSYGAAYTELCNPTIDISTRELRYGITDDIKAKAIIRSFSKKIGELLACGATNLQPRGTKNNITLVMSMADRLKILLRNGLYASRNNIAHGKVSSRLNSETANRESYYANIYLYVAGYIILSILLVELKYAYPIVVRQAFENMQLL